MSYKANHLDEFQFLRQSILNRPQKDALLAAVVQEQRIRLHSSSEVEGNPAHNIFLNWVSSLLPADKFQYFSQVLQPKPLPTLELADNCYSEISNIFEATNRTLEVEFEDPKLNATLNTQFDHYSFIKHSLFERFKTAPNSILYLEPKEDGVPEPKFVDIEKVVHVEADRYGKISYVIWHVSTTPATKKGELDTLLYKAVTPTSYVLLEQYGDSITTKTYAEHLLPSAPAHFIYGRFIGHGDNIVVDHIMSKSLGDFDWLLFWRGAKRVLNLYAPFPIYSAYKQRCDYISPEGIGCKNGVIEVPLPADIAGVEGTFGTRACPNCSKSHNSIIGAGSFIEVDAPQSNDDPDLRDPITVTSADKVSLDYCVEEEQRLAKKIFVNIVGMGNMATGDFSMSPEQMEMSYETRKTVFIKSKEVFERTHKFLIDTYCQLAYPKGTYKHAYVNYGDQYVLRSQRTLAEEFTTMKDAGMPTYLLSAQINEFVNTKYKSSPLQKLRAQILQLIEPMPQFSVPEFLAIYNSAGLLAGVDPFTVGLKVNFMQIMQAYEAAYAPIEHYNTQAISTPQRAQRILQTLRAEAADPASPFSTYFLPITQPTATPLVQSNINRV